MLTKAPEGLAYTNDYAQKALDALKGDGDVDVTGTGLQAGHRQAQPRRRVERPRPTS